MDGNWCCSTLATKAVYFLNVQRQCPAARKRSTGKGCPHIPLLPLSGEVQCLPSSSHRFSNRRETTGGANEHPCSTEKCHSKKVCFSPPLLTAAHEAKLCWETAPISKLQANHGGSKRRGSGYQLPCPRLSGAVQAGWPAGTPTGRRHASGQ